MIEELAPDVFIQRHPLSFLGCRMGRVVTLVRLASGKLIIHSTARFGREDIDEIRALGDPECVIEATRFHDTFSKAGRAAFPDVPYLVPPGFPGGVGLGATELGEAIGKWEDEFQVIPIKGMPKAREHVFFHRASKTLIVADLIFNLPAVGPWSQMFLRLTAGIHQYPGMSRLFRFLIKDRPAFVASIEAIAALDFERIVVAHGDPIVEDAKAKYVDLMAKHGFLKPPSS